MGGGFCDNQTGRAHSMKESRAKQAAAHGPVTRSWYSDDGDYLGPVEDGAE